MCEDTKNYLWTKQDLLGQGATSKVYKAYNKSTGEIVAAKVYQCSSDSDTQTLCGQENHDRFYRDILNREFDILRSTNHENIVRYIALESIVSTNALENRQVLLIEYCNGGSLKNQLNLPENHYGLKESDFMLCFRHLTNALKYLHDKNTIHRDIKPDNIMLSVDSYGERIYKLADLGVARLINEGENVFTTIVGTPEYIHPELIRAVADFNNRKAETPTDFPFEVDLWSLGVTLYQCATGQLPFQSFSVKRADIKALKHILDKKPAGQISGIEKSVGGDIKWSDALPDTCRLSKDIKQRLEVLLKRLLESNRRRLMTFEEYFSETDHIFNLIPIYYLNLKYFILTCTYFEPTNSISDLYNRIREENRDKKSVEYFCFFLSVPYPIKTSKQISIKTFCDELPISTSRENPLVFYTFTPTQHNDQYCPTFHIPNVNPIRQYNDVAAACDWSKDEIGLFYYLKAQLIEYQYILKTAQCSTTVIQNHLRSDRLDFLCKLRSKLNIFRAVEGLKNILDEINRLINSSSEINSLERRLSQSGTLPIGFSHLYDTTASPNSESVSTESSLAARISQPLKEHIDCYETSYLQPYNVLKAHEQVLRTELNTKKDKNPFEDTLWVSQCTKIYSAWIQQVDKFLKSATDIDDSLKKDRLLTTFVRLQIDSHFRRRANLKELHEKYIQFALEECYPHVVQVFTDYNDWIRQRLNFIHECRAAQKSFEKQCQYIMNYIDNVSNLGVKKDEMDEKTKRIIEPLQENLTKLENMIRELRLEIEKN